MTGKRQFSLSYLLGEVGLFALAMGLTRLVLSPHDLSSIPPLTFLLFILTAGFAAIACWGAAIGGLFGRMLVGARVALYAAFLLFFVSLLLHA